MLKLMKRILCMYILATLTIISCRPVVKEYRNLKSRTYADSRDTSPGDSLQWPNGQKAAVSLTYDDGLDCHLDIVVPDLEKYNLRGSFFLSGNSTSVGSRLEEWREIAARGHELGNHSLTHSCGEAGVPGTESFHELQIMNTLLRAIDGKKERTYAYPCRDTDPKEWDIGDSVQYHFMAARIASPISHSLEEIGPFSIPSRSMEHVGSDDLIRYAEEAAEKGTIAVYVFHGVEGKYLNVSREAHEELLKYLDENRDVYWTDTFVNVSKNLIERLNP